MTIDVSKVMRVLDISDGKESIVKQVTDLITSSITLIENYCNRKFSLETHTEKFIGNKNDYVITKNFPVIEVLNSPIPVIFIDRNEISFSRELTKGVTYLIQYRAGYEVFPADLEQAVIELVGWRYKRMEHIDVSSVRTENGSTTSYITDEIPFSVKFVLDRYTKSY